MSNRQPDRPQGPALPGEASRKVRALRRWTKRYFPVVFLATALAVIVAVFLRPSGPPPPGIAPALRPAPHGAFLEATTLTAAGVPAYRVPAADVARWTRDLRSKRLPARAAAWRHVWLGEYRLTHDEQPEVADRQFRQAQHLTKRADVLYGLAAYDRAVALFDAGAYQEAKEAFRALLTPRTPLHGYDRRACALWFQRARSCAGYHEARSAMGIPEPPRLDPNCGAAALAACLHSLSLPFDAKAVRARCRVTGEGSTMQDLLDAAPRLGARARVITADDWGLRHLPKPLVAYVERDHFVAVVRADNGGVSYLCSDCGAWPGGRVDLTWKQWRSLSPGVYAAVSKPGSAWDRTLTALLDPAAVSKPKVARVASAGSLSGLGLGAQQFRPIVPLSLLRPHVLRYMAPALALRCGGKIGAMHDCDPSSPEDSGSGGDGGAHTGDPVNLATGEEQYAPRPDLAVYNPHGPSVLWGRTYQSLRGPSDGYQCDDFGVGWSQPYNTYVLDPDLTYTTDGQTITMGDGSDGGGDTDGGTDGTTNGGTDGTTNGGTDGTTNGGTDGTTNGGTDGTTNGGTDGTTNGGTDGTTNGGTDGTTNGGTDGTTNGGTDGTTNGGTSVGSTVGTSVGSTVGTSVGSTVGTSVGSTVGGDTNTGDTNGGDGYGYYPDGMLSPRMAMAQPQYVIWHGPPPPPAGTKYLMLPSGGTVRFTLSFVDGHAVCTVDPGVGLHVEWNLLILHTPSGQFIDPLGEYVITLPNRTQWVMSHVAEDFGNAQTRLTVTKTGAAYALTQIIDPTGHAINLRYSYRHFAIKTGPDSVVTIHNPNGFSPMIAVIHSGTYGFSVGLPLLDRIDDEAGVALLTLLRSGAKPDIPADENGWIPLDPGLYQSTGGDEALETDAYADGTRNVFAAVDRYGRQVCYSTATYHNTNTPAAFPQFYQELTGVTQVAAATEHPADVLGNRLRYQYGYTNLSNLDGGETVAFLTSISVPSPTGAGTSACFINYDPATDFVANLTDANGNVRTYTSVDAVHTKVQVSHGPPAADGSNVLFSHVVGYDDPHGGQTSDTDGAGRTTFYAEYHDPNAPTRPSLVMDGSQYAQYQNTGQAVGTSYVWDMFGNLHQTTSARGVVTKLTWGFPASSLAAAAAAAVPNTVSQPSAPWLGELVSVQQGDQPATTVTYYEPYGLVASVTQPSPEAGAADPTFTTQYAYDITDNPGVGLGNVTRIIRPQPGIINQPTLTTTTTFSYDPANPAKNAPTQVSDGTNTVHLSFDYNGLRQAIDASGRGIALDYNIASQVTKVTGPSTAGGGPGSVLTGYLYPGGPRSSSTLFSQANAQVQRVDYTYGPEGEMLSAAGATGTISCDYDAAYRPTALHDGNDHVTHYAYNASGYPDSVTYPGTGTEQFLNYDVDGNLLGYRDPMGRETDYTYNDVEGALTDIHHPADPSLDVHVVYDGFGRPQSVGNATGTASYAYGDAGQLVSKIVSYAGLPSQVLSYDYYADGSRKSLTTPAGTFAYSYSPDGSLATVTNPQNEETGWGYDAAGRLTAQNILGVASTNFSYDAQDRLTDATTTQTSWSPPSSGPLTLSEIGGLQYDGSGSLIAKTAQYDPSFGGQTLYSYGAGEQLTRDQFTPSLSGAGTDYQNDFAYDAAGNPTTFRNTSGLTYNADNQRTDASYDADGNLTGHNGSTLSYDGEDRMTHYGGALACGYTAGGLRAWKQGADGQKTYFLYDGMLPVCELDATGAVKATNTWGANGLVSRRVEGDPLGTVFYTFDAQGNPLQRLTHTGEVRTSLQFDAFGARRAAAGVEPATGPADPYAGFSSQWGGYTDPETGLVLMGLRYYDPQQGRFITRDPIGMAGGLNLYRYADNDPVDFLDPTGTSVWVTVVHWYMNGMGGTSEFVDHWLMNDSTEGLGNAVGQYEVGCGSGWQVVGAAGNFAGNLAMNVVPGGGEAHAGLDVAAHFGEDALAHFGEDLEARCFLCFPAGTPVQMADGTTKPIEQVQTGDLVKSRDPKTGKDQVARVAGTRTRMAPVLVTVGLKDKRTGHVERVTCTPEHPLFVKDKGWVAAGALAQGNQIVTRAGPALSVSGLGWQRAGETTGGNGASPSPGGTQVYNFEVEGTHAYFVGNADGGVLAHNTCRWIGAGNDKRMYVRDFATAQKKLWEWIGDRAEMFRDTSPARHPDLDILGKKLLFGLRGTYHVDDEVVAGVLQGHNNPAHMIQRHIQIHDYDGTVYRIFYGPQLLVP